MLVMMLTIVVDVGDGDEDRWEEREGGKSAGVTALETLIFYLQKTNQVVYHG